MRVWFQAAAVAMNVALMCIYAAEQSWLLAGVWFCVGLLNAVVLGLAIAAKG